MGKPGIAATECNYKEINRQLKEQFIHGLNDKVTNEQVLVWARRVAAQKVQSAILESLNETKDFDKIFTRNTVKRQNEMQLQE